MTREDLLKHADTVYAGTRAVLRATPPDRMSFRPRPDMLNISQLIRHIASACGSMFKFVIEGEFQPMTGTPELPGVEQYLGYDTVQEALDHLDRDEKALRDAVMSLTEEEFANKTIQAPWESKPTKACLLALGMVEHLSNHRMQLFLYLRILGQPVNTLTLYGVPGTS